MTDQAIIAAVEGHCRDGLSVCKQATKFDVLDLSIRVGYLAKCLETILWECSRRDAEPIAILLAACAVERCDDFDGEPRKERQEGR